jgi:hypothetical protein
LTFDIGKFSVTGTTECRALKVSIWSIAVGLPVGEPATDLSAPNQAEGGNGNWLEHAPDNMKNTFWRERPK